LNNAVAMLPARDQSESNAFDQTPMGAWARGWLDWADAEYECLHNTIPIAALDRGADGTTSVLDDGSRGFLFLFNPGPRSECAELAVDEGMDISNASASSWFLAHEIYPREEKQGRRTPVGVWSHGSTHRVCVAPQSAKVLRLTRIGDVSDRDVLPLPLVLNLSYVNATAAHEASGRHSIANYRVDITGAVGLAGEDSHPVVLAGVMNKSTERLHEVYVNGHIVTSKVNDDCGDYASWVDSHGVGCATTRFLFGGDRQFGRGYGCFARRQTVVPRRLVQLVSVGY
jgi:hypothetical protein